MKAFRIKKHRNGVKVSVVVVPEEEKRVRRSKPLPPGVGLPKPKLPRVFISKITPPTHDGVVEFTFEGKL